MPTLLMREDGRRGSACPANDSRGADLVGGAPMDEVRCPIFNVEDWRLKVESDLIGAELRTEPSATPAVLAEEEVV